MQEKAFYDLWGKTVKIQKIHLKTCYKFFLKFFLFNSIRLLDQATEHSCYYSLLVFSCNAESVELKFCIKA